MVNTKIKKEQLKKACEQPLCFLFLEHHITHKTTKNKYRSLCISALIFPERIFYFLTLCYCSFYLRDHVIAFEILFFPVSFVFLHHAYKMLRFRDEGKLRWSNNL